MIFKRQPRFKPTDNLDYQSYTTSSLDLLKLNKDNMVLGIVRALNFAGMRTDEDLFGLTTKYEPF